MRERKWHHILTQPSTAAGAGLIVHGIAEAAGALAPVATEAGEAASEAVTAAAGGNWAVAAASLVGGLFAVLKSDRSNHD